MKRFMSALRMWISAAWRSGCLAAMRSPNALRQRIFAPTRLRAWYPVQRFQKARPWCRVARKVSLRTRAAGQSSFHGRPFLRTGMIGTASRPMMAVWQRRVRQREQYPWPDGLCAPLGECMHSPAGQRLAAPLNAMLAGLPRAIAEELDASAGCHPAGHHAVMSREGTSRLSGPLARRYGI